MFDVPRKQIIKTDLMFKILSLEKANMRAKTTQLNSCKIILLLFEP